MVATGTILVSGTALAPEGLLPAISVFCDIREYLSGPIPQGTTAGLLFGVPWDGAAASLRAASLPCLGVGEFRTEGVQAALFWEFPTHDPRVPFVVADSQTMDGKARQILAALDRLKIGPDESLLIPEMYDVYV